MAQLQIRGIGMKDIPYEAAKTIQRQIENKLIKNEDWVTFGNFSCKAGSIIGVTLDPETTDNGHSKFIDNEYYEDRMKILRTTPELRAERTGFFETFFQIMEDRRALPAAIDKAKVIQLEFFKANPYRLECDPKLFAGIITRKSAVNGRFFHLIERIVSTDRDMAKYKLGRANL